MEPESWREQPRPRYTQKCHARLERIHQTPPAGDSKSISGKQHDNLPAAAEAWKAIASHNPRDAAAFASYGVLSRLGDYPEAASAYKKALAVDPHLSGIQLYLGLAEIKQGHFEEAIAPLVAAFAADFHSMQVRTLPGLSYCGTKRFAEGLLGI